jgi:hypothetical protein
MRPFKHTETAMRFNKTLKQNLMLYLGNYGELSAAITRRAERLAAAAAAQLSGRFMQTRERSARGRAGGTKSQVRPSARLHFLFAGKSQKSPVAG